MIDQSLGFPPQESKIRTQLNFKVSVQLIWPRYAMILILYMQVVLDCIPLSSLLHSTLLPWSLRLFTLPPLEPALPTRIEYREISSILIIPLKLLLTPSIAVFFVSLFPGHFRSVALLYTGSLFQLHIKIILRSKHISILPLCTKKKC